MNSFLASLPDPLDTTGPNGDYGDLAGVVSVQSFGNWIYEVTGVPEPSGLSLLLLGLSGLALVCRRK